MVNKYWRILPVLGFVLIACIACGKKEGFDLYKEVMDKELQSGKQADSLFLGMSFGMTSKNFFLHCWEMNKKGLFTDGQNNTSVLYKLNHHELKHAASMNFYPHFYDNKIYKMQTSFNYDGWAPWNKHLSSDSLLTDVLVLYRKWYPGGSPFIRISDPQKGVIYVKLDGNRRITVGQYDEIHVKVDYTDLVIEQKIKKVE
ncbi:hypothetical protein [Xanthocytophaga agilis]|uniref:Lipoprotein n=1 Tax=Xanthocytophaga agilis TaxID=3048010 RepID=A0AAE3R9Z0_9BACT|nr:hypothetical protein [Xanthocytophaga agilis]MDJ1506399.1 hypothetical protein [Xanthocytophaga agilis]